MSEVSQENEYKQSKKAFLLQIKVVIQLRATKHNLLDPANKSHHIGSSNAGGRTFLPLIE